MNLQTKVLTFCLAIGMAPVVVTSYLAHDKASASLEASALEASKELESQAVDKMAAIRDLKAARVEEYFNRVQAQIQSFAGSALVVDAMAHLPGLYDGYLTDGNLNDQDITRMRGELRGFYEKKFAKEYRKRTGHDYGALNSCVAALGPVAVALQHAYIHANTAPLGSKDTLDVAPDKSRYSDYHEATHPAIRDYLKQLGLYDIFLCRPGSGEVLYSVFKEIDYATSLTQGSFADSGLGAAFRGTDELASGETFVFTDFNKYSPSYESPACFIGSPVYRDGEKLGIVIFQLPLDAASKIMAGASGLGESGDSYLVGPEGLMRSDSRQDPEHRSVLESFASPASGTSKSAAISAALAGETGEGLVDNFDGVQTVAAWMPLDILGKRWALVTEISTEEGLAVIATIREHSEASISALVAWILGSMAIVLVIVLVVGFATARTFLKPITSASNTIEAMGAGDLSTRIENTSTDEIGRMTQMVDSVLENLVGVFGTDTVQWQELGESIEQASGLAGMIEQASLNIIQADLDGKIKYVNQACLASLASASFVTLPSTGPKGSQVRDILRIPTSVAGNLHIGQLPWTQEYKIDGESIELSASAVEGVDGVAQGLMVTWTIKTAEREVQDRIHATTDELNNFAGLLRTSAKDLLSAAESTSESATRTQRGTQEVSDDTNAVSSASEEMSSTVSSIAQSSRDLADAVEQAVGAGNRAVEVVGSLTSANDQISRVSDTIANIADQTNLLALNATIEAAGAGEAGRGFAVVASEVKDLARETMTATSSIAEQVHDIAGRSNQVSEAINDITRIVAGVSDLAITLATAVEEQDITTREISEATSRSADRVGLITAEMEELSNSAESANAGARSVLEAAEQLTQLAQDLSKAGLH